MDIKTYKKLLQSSESFKKLSAQQQKRLMEATGKDMEEYALIYLAEKQNQREAIKELSEGNDAVHKTYLDKIASTIKDKRKDDEASSTKKDKEYRAKLIDKLNKL